MFKTIKNDLPASIVVFFVALPLCLGIALASGAPLFSGLIAGIVGGVVVGSISGSKIGVSGPAAGLAAIVLVAIQDLGFETFLVAVVLAGVFQILLGLVKAGVIGYYFPSSVIKGMLTGIGIIIFMKQIPFFFGFDGKLKDLFTNFGAIEMGSTVLGIVSLAILLLWSSVLAKKGKIFQIVQGPIVVVVLGVIYYLLTKDTSLNIAGKNIVNVPSIDTYINDFKLPNFAEITNPKVLLTAFTIGLVASLETLLCVEATDKLDPHKNVTPTNRELFAQGAGNIVSGLIGGLPVTQVIVRSSANINSGGRTKLSAIIHGFLLIVAVVLVPNLMNLIPLAVLAAVLLIVGYKLAKPSLFKKMYELGWQQFLPFIVTVVGIVGLDLLKGIALGLVVGIVVILIKSYRNSHFLHKEDKSNGEQKMKMTLAEEVTFINKGTILKELDSLPENSYLELDVRKTRYLDYDIIEILEDFALKAKERNINIKLYSERGIVENPESFIEFFKLRPKTA
ncbi:membrane protein [Tenacibaculum holothuriorum]|uniref:Membrane protein n=1 Tax=Tenacibaculum holothuriorum TaxID=1635173 RepID=A0A1Y2PEA1_9FLAO|nr:SulP family inorganic anion transporter [Tenacibaculum holothuriorum]OSY88802.1 membrane protein [Tenacibaculum holothuriorum]